MHVNIVTPLFIDGDTEMAESKKIASILLCLAYAAIAAGLLTSCASMGQTDKDKKAIDSSVETFNRAFRWEDFDTAALFISPEAKLQFWNEVDKFKGKIHVIDFQIRDLDWQEKRPIATAIVYFQYYRTASPSIQTITFEQKWYYVEKEKVWRLGKSGFDAITARNDL